jgi:hypothetical protein
VSDDADRYEVQLTITATVHIKDGAVTYSEAENGWGDAYIEAYDADGNSREVGDESRFAAWEHTEMGQVLALLTGKWEISQK